MAKKRFAQIKVPESARVWDYRIPDYLLGKLDEGDTVVVADECGELGFGVVAGKSTTTAHRDSHVRTVVDKVHLGRYKRHVEGKAEASCLMADMARRLAELEALDAYKKAAKSDEAMAALYEDWRAAAG